jgi:hypothetical protein
MPSHSGREAAIVLGLLRSDEYDRLVDAKAMLGPQTLHRRHE